MAATPDQMERHMVPTTTIAITEARKQMLIDNLQLEVTERARKLRAQYALQAQALRTRLEMRVNRIPHSLRHTNMQELVEKYSQPQTVAVTITSPQRIPLAAPSRGLKRSSDAMPDKENEQPAGDLENPKKRIKTGPSVTALPPIKPSARTASRKPDPSSILSPKSHNSRTLPASPFKTTFPFKPTSPFKSASPVKPASPFKDSALPKPTARLVTASKTTRPASRQAKPTSRPSTGSEASNGTTIVKRTPAPTTGAAKKSATAATASTKSRTAGIKNALSSLTGSKRGRTTGKAAAVAAAVATTNASATTVGGRTLRKRG